MTKYSSEGRQHGSEFESGPEEDFQAEPGSALEAEAGSGPELGLEPELEVSREGRV